MKSLRNYALIVKEILFSAGKMKRIQKIENKMKRKEEAFLYINNAFHKILKKMDVQVTTKGLEHILADEPVLFVANHQGNFDILVLLAHSPVPISFVAKKELGKYPIIKRWIDNLDCLLIDRSKPKHSIRMIHEATKDMTKTGSIVLFPEGTRSKKKDMQPFKRAGLTTAISNDVTIVPVTIDGTYLIMEANANRLQSANVTLTFHAPTTKRKDETKDETIERIRKTIASGLDDI